MPRCNCGKKIEASPGPGLGLGHRAAVLFHCPEPRVSHVLGGGGRGEGEGEGGCKMTCPTRWWAVSSGGVASAPLTDFLAFQLPLQKCGLF